MPRSILNVPLAASLLGAVLALQGCKLAASDLNSGLKSDRKADSFKTASTVPVKVSKLPKLESGAAVKPKSATSAKAGAATGAGRPEPLPVREGSVDFDKTSDYGKFLDMKAKTSAVIEARSARCRQILAQAGLDATMLRSPTVSATLDQDGRGGMSVGYDVLDVRRARMKVELAQVQCDRYEASVRLAQLLVTSTQALSRAGYLAKANYLARNRSALKRVQRRAVVAVNQGLVTVHASNAIRQRINTVIGQEARTRGEAERREVVDGIQVKSVRNVDQKLLVYERRIYELKKALRRTDAFEVSINGGYNYDSQDDPFSVDAGNDLYAKVKVGVRLGVFHPDRSSFEEELKASRMDALYEANTGALWRADRLSGVNGRVLRNLQMQRKQVASALKEARRTVAASAGADDPWLVSSGLRSRIDIVALGAELAGLDATIADVARLDRKLRFKE